LSNPIELNITNIFTTIRGPFPFIDLDKLLSYVIPGSFMSPKYRLCPIKACKQNINPFTGKCKKCGTRRIWDGRARFLKGGKTIPAYFPTGCVSEVIGLLKEKGFDYKIVDLREKPPVLDLSDIKNLTLIDPDDATKIRVPWEHQMSAIEAALKATRGLIVVPTRGGKTSIISGILKTINLPSAIFINQVTVGRQLQREISAMTGVEVGFIGNGEFNPGHFTVCMVQTLMNELSLSENQKKDGVPKNPLMVEFVKGIKVMAHDEVHHIGDNAWYNLTTEFENAFYRFGLSGTMDMRSDGDDILTRAATGKIVYEIPEQTLIDKGIVAKPIIHFYTINEPDNIGKADYKTAYEHGIVNNEQLNKLTAQITYNLHKTYKILILFERQNHLINLEEQFKLLNFDGYEILTGKDNKQSYRKEIIDEFAFGNLQVLCASKILDEGVTMPAIDLVIRLGCMKTDIKSKQQVGRGQGAKVGKKNEIHIVDFLVNTNEHLANHSETRFNMYHGLKYEIKFESEPLTTL
jgi:superfamily II DNA or RNA helicase